MSAASQVATVGGLPTMGVDVPICGVFLAIFVAGVASNMSIFVANRRRGRKFIMSLMMYGFCLIRIVACSTRIAWATSLTNSNLAIVSQIFNSAGTIILYILNLIFAQRVLRAKQPAVGWNVVVRNLQKLVYALLVGSLIMGIVVLGVAVNSTDPKILSTQRSIMLAMTTFSLFVAALPIVLLAAAYLLPRSEEEETFGEGSLNSKSVILVVSITLAIILAGFKAGTTWEHPRPMSQAAWFHSKAAYYCFGFMIEVMIVGLFLATRVDRRFIVPNKCKGPGDYTNKRIVDAIEKDQTNEKESS